MVIIFLHHEIKHLPAEENDTKISWIWLSNFDSMPRALISNFAWFLRPMSVDCVGNGLSYARFRLRCMLLLDTDQWASANYWMLLWILLIGRKNQAKFENDCVSRNWHKIKNLNQLFCIFWNTRYSTLPLKSLNENWSRIIEIGLL